MPDNPLKKNAGNKIRALSFLEYFKERGHQVHFVSEYFWGEWNEENITEFKNSGYAFKTHILKRKASKRNFLYYFLFYKLPNFFYQRKLGILPVHFPEMVTRRLRKAFNGILKETKFDYIVVNYASWSTLIENNALIGTAKTILDTHDLLSAQSPKKSNIGSSFQEEMRRLSLFDQVFAISTEEQYIFEQFCNSPVKLIPMMITKPMALKVLIEDRNFDIIYVASKNPHNIDAANWFITQVYPLLPESLKICIIGQITQCITVNNSNITLVPFADDLNTYYQNAKIAICPMLSGTGTKIKVIEALSYELPVVCNSRGVDGLINKINNGCLVSDTAEGFKAHIISLLENSATYQQQSLNAKQTFDAFYELKTCYKVLDKLF